MRKEIDGFLKCIYWLHPVYSFKKHSLKLLSMYQAVSQMQMMYQWLKEKKSLTFFGKESDKNDKQILYNDSLQIFTQVLYNDKIHRCFIMIILGKKPANQPTKQTKNQQKEEEQRVSEYKLSGIKKQNKETEDMVSDSEVRGKPGQGDVQEAKWKKISKKEGVINHVTCCGALRCAV